MILNDTIKTLLNHPSDGALTFVTQGEDGPHLAATWNSYVVPLNGDEFLIPAGGMQKTELNLSRNDRISLILACRNVPGFHGDGAGFYIEGKASFLTSGPEADTIREKFPWARGALHIVAQSSRQIN